ncbi:hypothetical protein L6452_08785 [Arctium lappa]|uniref:Uncharacterized protein n=1 Tax=Arctium lappa TaxID=4217 RepID=A0ACB9DIK0_ARCLA|nr:hypothetical protein L6452_08785 [Arctium lappa]
MMRTSASAAAEAGGLGFRNINQTKSRIDKNRNETNNPTTCLQISGFGELTGGERVLEKSNLGNRGCESTYML